jgi:hypothetical protein
LVEGATGGYEYLGDLLFLNVLDQLWIQEVFEPHAGDACEALRCEITRCHHPETVEELFLKRNILAKMAKEIKAIETNQ